MKREFWKKREKEGEKNRQKGKRYKRFGVDIAGIKEGKMRGQREKGAMRRVRMWSFVLYVLFICLFVCVFVCLFFFVWFCSVS